jgi:tRNA 2-thiouridine synthesizing protein D
MRIALTLTAAPDSGDSIAAALRFAEAALADGHEIVGVFLLQDAVTLASAMPRAALADRWLEVGRAAGLDIGVCSGAAARRQIQALAAHERDLESVGQPDPEPAFEPNRSGAGFRRMGMGQIVMALAAADRVVEFRG